MKATELPSLSTISSLFFPLVLQYSSTLLYSFFVMSTYSPSPVPQNVNVEVLKSASGLPASTSSVGKDATTVTVAEVQAQSPTEASEPQYKIVKVKKPDGTIVKVRQAHSLASLQN